MRRLTPSPLLFSPLPLASDRLRAQRALHRRRHLESEAPRLCRSSSHAQSFGQLRDGNLFLPSLLQTTFEQSPLRSTGFTFDALRHDQ